MMITVSQFYIINVLTQ